MKILITGSTGFIGQHVFKESIKRGHKVIPLVRNKDSIKSYPLITNYKPIFFDIGSGIPSLKDFGTPDVLIHLAWDTLSNFNSPEHLEVGLFENIKFIKALLQQGLKNIVIIGTCLEFGLQNGPLSPNMKTDPKIPYAVAKDTLRRWVEYLHKDFEFNHKWIRLFYVFGEGQNKSSLLPQLTKAINDGLEIFRMSNGEQIRDFINVSEVSSMILDIIEKEKPSGNYHCCSGKPISVRKFVENYIKSVGSNIELDFGYYSYPDYEPFAFWGEKKNN